MIIIFFSLTHKAFQISPPLQIPLRVGPFFQVVSAPLSKAFDDAKMEHNKPADKRINKRFQKQIFLTDFDK
jgi:hypothetical protein